MTEDIPIEIIRRKIKTCQTLILRLIELGKEYSNEISETVHFPGRIIDFRILQFGFLQTTLHNIYYDCGSLEFYKSINENLKNDGINEKPSFTLDSHRKYITFNAIIRVFASFEYGRKEYEWAIIEMAKEQNLKGDYYQLLELMYPSYARSFRILKEFRDTIHSNARWNYNEKKQRESIKYKLLDDTYSLKSGEPFQYDYWFLYKIFRDSMTLHKELALINKSVFIKDRKHGTNSAYMVFNDDLNAWAIQTGKIHK